MLRSDTYFEQIPLEAIKPLLEQALPGDASAERTPEPDEKVPKTSLEAEA